MEKGMYSVYDRVTNTYSDPFLAVNREDCLRRCAYSFRNNPYVKDLMLYCVGSFVSDMGVLYAPAKPEFVCNVNELISSNSVEVTPDEQ